MPESVLGKIVRMRVFGKSPTSAFLRVSEWIWNRVPASLMGLPPVRAYGNFLQTLVRLQAERAPNFGTLFLRNRPQLELMRCLADQKGKGSILKILVLACSKGAEVYSILWSVRSVRPDLKVFMHAVDISNEVLEFAQKGVYSLTAPEFTVVPIFEGLTEDEMQKLFDIDGDRDRATIKSWIKEGIIWRLGDAEDSKLFDIAGPQDIVVANNFLCHMNPLDAEKCLRNISGLVTSGGYLFVSGVDLDVRSKVARDLGWKPLNDLIEEIHDGDPTLRRDWPFKWWGLEPLNKKRQDWKIRYASVFQLG